MIRNILLLCLATFLLASCVPNKDIVYFQGSPHKNKDIKRILNSPYRLQVDDILNIDIISTNEKLVEMFKKTSGSTGNANMVNPGAGYFTGYSVDLNGNIRLPILGEVNVLGYTTVEVRKKLEKEIRRFFKEETDIFISVKLSAFMYTIIGEIRSPGQKTMIQNSVSIIDAIANAGDITNVGNRKNVEIIRNNQFSTEKFTIDLTSIDAFNSDLFFLKPNDIVYIKPLKQKAWGTGTTALQSLTTIFSIFSLVTSTIIISRNIKKY